MVDLRAVTVPGKGSPCLAPEGQFEEEGPGERELWGGVGETEREVYPEETCRDSGGF